MLRAIGRLLGWLWSGLDALRKVLHLIVLLVLFGTLWGVLSRPIPYVPGNAALVIAPAGPVVEQLEGDPVERTIAEGLRREPTQTLLRDLVESVEAATDDDRIRALYLDLGGLEGAGIAKLAELTKAVDGFRASGKPVIAYSDYYDQRQYYLAAHADEVYLDPSGVAFIEGYENYGIYLKDAIDKLAIDWNVFRVGQYKSAVETFSRNDMSPAEREESRAWLDSIWTTYKADVAKARGIEPAALQHYADEVVSELRQAHGDLARMALDAGLVTGLRGRTDVEKRLIEITGEDEDTNSFVSVDHWSYLANVHSQEALEPEPDDTVAVIIATGEIVPGEQPPGTIGSDTLAAQLRDALHDDAVKAVVLRIDSPGGSTFASEVIRREVAALHEAGKPVVASMSGLAASGGYYIAMDADRIIANPATLTGSIGVFAMFPTFQRTLDRLGVHTDGMGTTNLSGEFRVDRPLGDVAKDVLQQSVENEYRKFIEHVARNRKQEVPAIDAIAQGRVWSGADAKRLGLVDDLGTYEDAIDEAAKLANLGDDYSVEVMNSQISFAESLGLRIQSSVARLIAPLLPRSVFEPVPKLVRPLAQHVEKQVEQLVRLSDPRSLYSYCFCAVE
jgi:protease-4